MRYWLVLPNGCRQLIDPRYFDIDALAERARRIGGRLMVDDGDSPEPDQATAVAQRVTVSARFEPPLSALGPLFRARLERIHRCTVEFDLDMNARPTSNMLGGYYKRRRLVRVYTHDRKLGRRPREELFDTFLHEVAHHLEYTEPRVFGGQSCGRVHGRMHSPLFWSILAELKRRWGVLQANQARVED